MRKKHPTPLALPLGSFSRFGGACHPPSAECHAPRRKPNDLEKCRKQHSAGISRIIGGLFGLPTGYFSHVLKHRKQDPDLNHCHYNRDEQSEIPNAFPLAGIHVHSSLFSAFRRTTITTDGNVGGSFPIISPAASYITVPNIRFRVPRPIFSRQEASDAAQTPLRGPALLESFAVHHQIFGRDRFVLGITTSPFLALISATLCMPASFAEPFTADAFSSK